MTPPGEVMRAALPVSMRLESYTSLSLVNGWEERLVDESELSRDEKEIVGVFRERGEICMAEVEKLLRRKDVYVAVRALLEKEIIGIKESVDDLFKPKIERWVRWKQKFASEELDGILDSLKRARTQYKMLCDWVYYSDEHRVEGVPRTEFIQKIVVQPRP